MFGLKRKGSFLVSFGVVSNFFSFKPTFLRLKKGKPLAGFKTDMWKAEYSGIDNLHLKYFEV
jgi:hypothetical protein